MKKIGKSKAKSKSVSSARRATRKNPSDQKSSSQLTDSVVEVLYQKLGDRWYAFSLIEEEVFVGSIPPAELDPVLSKEPGLK